MHRNDLCAEPPVPIHPYYILVPCLRSCAEAVVGTPKSAKKSCVQWTRRSTPLLPILLGDAADAADAAIAAQPSTSVSRSARSTARRSRRRRHHHPAAAAARFVLVFAAAATRVALPPPPPALGTSPERGVRGGCGGPVAGAASAPRCRHCGCAPTEAARNTARRTNEAKRHRITGACWGDFEQSHVDAKLPRWARGWQVTFSIRLRV